MGGERQGARGREEREEKDRRRDVKVQKEGLPHGSPRPLVPGSSAHHF